MEKDFLGKAIIMMKNLMKQPCSISFLDLEDPSQADSYHYYSVVPNPLSLQIIFDRLSRGSYLDIKSWKKDIYLIYSNSVRAFGLNHCKSILSSHLVFRFEKMLKELNMRNYSVWSAEYLNYSTKMAQYIQKNTKVRRKKTIKPKQQEIVKPKHKASYLTEVNKFLEASTSLNTANDAKAMAYIISKMQPGLINDDFDVNVHIDDINPETMLQLIEYTKSRFKALHYNYPE